MPKEKKNQQPPASLDTGRLLLLVTITERQKADFFMDLIQSFDVNMQFAALAEGTAGAEMLTLLGLAVSEKAVIFSIIREDMAPPALRAIDEKFRTLKNSKGIAYTVPLSGVIGVSVFGFMSNNRSAVKIPSGGR